MIGEYNARIYLDKLVQELQSVPAEAFEMLDMD